MKITASKGEMEKQKQKTEERMEVIREFFFSGVSCGITLSNQFQSGKMKKKKEKKKRKQSSA